MVITSTYPRILVNQFIINDRVIFTSFALQTRIAVFRRGLTGSKQFAIYTFFSLWFFESEFAKRVTICPIPLCCCYECCISVKILCPSTFEYFFSRKEQWIHKEIGELIKPNCSAGSHQSATIRKSGKIWRDLPWPGQPLACGSHQMCLI